MGPETRVNEEKSKKLEERIEQFKKADGKTLLGKIVKKGRLFLIVDVGGSLLPYYQKRHAKQLGWEEKDMTIRNALYCGILPAMGYFVAHQYFGDNMPEILQKILYGYSSTLMFAQNIGRMTLAQITKNPVPSISVMGGLGNLGYFIADSLKKKRLRKKLKPVEGVEPSTYSLQNCRSATELHRREIKKND